MSLWHMLPFLELFILLLITFQSCEMYCFSKGYRGVGQGGVGQCFYLKGSL